MSTFGKISGLTTQWKRPAILVRTAGDRLFRQADALARLQGWQVTTGCGGLSRTYRDPRFAKSGSDRP